VSSRFTAANLHDAVARQRCPPTRHGVSACQRKQGEVFEDVCPEDRVGSNSAIVEWIVVWLDIKSRLQRAFRLSALKKQSNRSTQS